MQEDYRGAQVRFLLAFLVASHRNFRRLNTRRNGSIHESKIVRSTYHFSPSHFLFCCALTNLICYVSANLGGFALLLELLSFLLLYKQNMTKTKRVFV